MHQVTNFLLMSRIAPPSLFEKGADFLLTPAKILFGGKRVIYLQDHSIHIVGQQDHSNTCVSIALKVIAFITLPIADFGVLLKLICLKDQNFRNFCSQKISLNSTCHPKLFEMIQHVHSTVDFVSDNPLQKGSLLFKPLDLSECSCKGTGAFHRFHSSRRNNLENALVRCLTEKCLDKSEPINLLSMGSGGLMSDFLTVEKLVLAGFKKITIDCVDPIGIDADRVERIRNFFAGYPNVSMEIHAYKNIDEVPTEKTNYSALLAIDYDTLFSPDFKTKVLCTSDLMKAYWRLSVNGFMALGFDEEDTISGPGMDPLILCSRPPIIHSLAKDLAEQLPQTEELSVCLPSLDFAGASHLLILSVALAIKKSNIQYHKISLGYLYLDECLNEEDSVDEDSSEDFLTMMKVLFPTIDIEITFDRKQKKTYDLLFTGSEEPEFLNNTYQSLLNPKSITYVLNNRGEISRQNNFQRNPTVSLR